MLLSFSYGCNTSRKDPTYAQAAYRQEQSARISSQVTPVSMDQKTREDLRLDEPNFDINYLEQKQSESYSEWKKRIKEQFLQNRDLYTYFYQEFERLEALRQTHQKELEEIKQINTTLEGRIKGYHESPELAKSDPTFAALSQKIPFTIHLVQPNETLYSISQAYYGTGDKVDDIISWNQGWIRSPQQLLAGLTLVLFFQDRQAERGQTTVNKYIREIQKSLNESLNGE
jgi:hypothetical protein